jgi:hypothetical protein
VVSIPAAEHGDFDSDGDVDGADFITWQTHYPLTQGAMSANGDANGDGDVDGADFAAWSANFPATPSPSFGLVPEPQSLVSMAVGGFVLTAFSACRYEKNASSL